MYMHCTCICTVHVYVQDHFKTAGPFPNRLNSFEAVRPASKPSGRIQSCRSEKLRFQHRQAGRLQSRPFPAWHSDQFVALLIRNGQEIGRTPRADLHANINPVISPVLYRSSTTAAVRTHICLADVT